MGMLAKIRRMHIRDGIPLRDCTANRALPQHHPHLAASAGNDATPIPRPQGPKRPRPVADQLRQWLQTDSHRSKRERRTGRVMFETLREQGYPAATPASPAFIRKWQEERSENPKRSAYVRSPSPSAKPSSSTGAANTPSSGLRRRLEVAHIKLCASRAFWVVAYPSQSHEMLFDAHARAFPPPSAGFPSAASTTT